MAIPFYHSDEGRDAYRVFMLPSEYECNEQWPEAIKAYEESIAGLRILVAAAKERAPKVYRRMFERALEVHEKRYIYLKAAFDLSHPKRIVPVPTSLSAQKWLEGGYGSEGFISAEMFWEARTSSKQVAEARSNLLHAQKGAQVGRSESAINATLRSPPMLNPASPPAKYFISESHESFPPGCSSHWLYVKDASNRHTLWALQVISAMEEPITIGVLRRANEFLPGMGAVQVRFWKTKGGAFRLTTHSEICGKIVETPDRNQYRSDWSPRRFEYGKRKFVWKAPGSKAPWETLYETKQVWPKKGSKTGKMEDETEEARLCWGDSKEQNSVGGSSRVIYFAGGLDQCFQEHALASQLARFLQSKHSCAHKGGNVADRLQKPLEIFPYAPGMRVGPEQQQGLEEVNGLVRPADIAGGAMAIVEAVLTW